MEWRTLHEIPLSTKIINEKSCEKSAKLIQGVGYNTRDNKKQLYKINRFEVRNTINGNVSIGIAFSQPEFIWLKNFLKSDLNFSIYEGKKLLTGIRIAETSFSITSIENDRSFGVVLNLVDKNIILKYDILFDIFLRFPDADNDNLKELTEDLYIAVLGNHIRLSIKAKCIACNNGIGEHDLCKEYYKNYLNKGEALGEALFSTTREELFISRFNKLMDLFGVNEHGRRQQLRFNLQYFTNNKDQLHNSLCAYLDLNEGVAYILDKIFSDNLLS